MQRIYVNNTVPKYCNGKWKWNDEIHTTEFEKLPEFAVDLKKKYIETGIYKFKLGINEIEEAIFHQEFQRSKTDNDSDFILLQDIKILVLFQAPQKILTPKFIKFTHTKTFDKIVHSLIIYMEYFLKFVEFLMVRRDEINSDNGQLQSNESTEIKRIYAEHLTQYRLLVARDYATLILGEGDTKPFHHLKPIVNISSMLQDKVFYEAFLTVCQQIVWIAMHRRAYDIIDHEIGRLFRTEHFMTPKPDVIKFTKVEKSMLYGKNYNIEYSRLQTTPLIQELKCISDENLPILWIGKRKYNGGNLRFAQLEMECIIPESQLLLIDVTHGVLGHPKKLYNTLLTLETKAVRMENYNEVYDPYHIVRQPSIKLPDLDAEKLRAHAKNNEPFYRIVSHWRPLSKEMFHKWKYRDDVIQYFKTDGTIKDLWMEAEKNINCELFDANAEKIIKDIKENFKKNGNNERS